MRNTMIVGLVLSIASILTSAGAENATQSGPGASAPPEKPLSGNRIVIAHRGASGYLPEHTLPAKALAYAMGADFLEQDVVLTRDKVLVLSHDAQIDTVSDVAKRFPDRKRKDGRYYAIDFTLAELKQLQLTERFNPRTGQPVFPNRFPKGQSTFSIVTLEEEIQFIQGLNKTTGRNVGLYVEIKSPSWYRKQGYDVSSATLEILSRYGYKTKSDPVYIQIFDFNEVKRVRKELGYQGRLILLLGEKMGVDNTDFAYFKTKAGLAEAAEFVDGVGPSLSSVASGPSREAITITDLVRNAHALKLEVHPYTARVDELPPYAKSIEEVLEVIFVQAGVDGVFTDHTDRVVNFVRAKAAQP